MQDQCEENFKTRLKDAKEGKQMARNTRFLDRRLNRKHMSVLPKLIYKGNVVSMIFLFCSRTGYTN